MLRASLLGVAILYVKMLPNPSRVYSPHHRPIIGVLRRGIVTLFGKLSVREDDELGALEIILMGSGCQFVL